MARRFKNCLPNAGYGKGSYRNRDGSLKKKTEPKVLVSGTYVPRSSALRLRRPKPEKNPECGEPGCCRPDEPCKEEQFYTYTAGWYMGE